MKNALWTYWENPKGSRKEPAYITLCRWTMLYNLKKCSLISVTPDNLEKYLPGITAKTQSVQAHNRGRLDRLKRIFLGDTRSLAIKCDLIRAHLLKHYGGIYIDSDAIVLNDIQQYFDLLDQHGFIIVKRASHGKSHVSINFYGSQPNHTIISEYVAAQSEKLRSKKIFDFTELGDVTLNPIADKYKERAYFIPERNVQSVTYEESESVLLSDTIEPEEVIGEGQSVFMLYNGIFKSHLKTWSVEDLYTSNLLVSKVFRTALPESAFKQFLGAEL